MSNALPECFFRRGLWLLSSPMRVKCHDSLRECNTIVYVRMKRTILDHQEVTWASFDAQSVTESPVL